MMSYNYKLVISYDGTSYHGWQVQPNGISIQSTIQEALKIFLRHDVDVIGSGRTDAGVHARAQTAHFHSDHPIDSYRFLRSINGLLPLDIRVNSIEAVPTEFHARYSAVGKVYHYHLCLGAVQNPFKRLYSLHVRHPLDLDKVKEGIELFKGTHDFAGFANAAHEGIASYDSVRNIQRFEMVQEDGAIRFEIEADGFLYKMVRNMVGTLLDIGAGKMQVADIATIFETCDRKLAGKAAAPHGLFLAQVKY